MTPAEVDLLSFRDISVLMDGARVRRSEAWTLNSRLCAMQENTVRSIEAMLTGKSVEAADLDDYLPDFFNFNKVEQKETDAAARWQQALKQEREAIERRNAKRLAGGLPALPIPDYKVG